jgi:hypothetical protein
MENEHPKEKVFLPKKRIVRLFGSLSSIVTSSSSSPVYLRRERECREVSTTSSTTKVKHHGAMVCISLLEDLEEVTEEKKGIGGASIFSQ